MADASFTQTSFLGGEWSKFYQGRMDHPKYKTAMNMCRNAIPVEEGACPRRPGTQFAATTRDGVYGRLLSYVFEDASPYIVEVTNGHLRFFNGPNLVFTPDVQLLTSLTSATGPAGHTGAVQVNLPTGATGTPWYPGDQVEMLFDYTTNVPPNAGYKLFNRQFSLSGATGGQVFTLSDPVTGADIPFDSTMWSPGASAAIMRVLDVATTITGSMISTTSPRIVQNEELALLLQSGLAPQSLEITQVSGSPQFATANLSPAAFLDGPYLDPVPQSFASASATGGVITLTINFATWSSAVTYSLGDRVLEGSNGYQCITIASLNHDPSTHPLDWLPINPGLAVNALGGFQASDVGRHVRLLSEPNNWNVNTAYTSNNICVQYPSNSGAYYISLKASTGVQPDTDLTAWLPTTSVSTWTWGIITAVATTNQASVVIVGPALLYDSATAFNPLIYTWRLGAYSQSTGWPTCGCFHEGRFWLSGAIPNRFDACMSGGIDSATTTITMSPTEWDGTVTDASAITYTLDSSDQNPIYWMVPNQLGIVAGTLGGEWMIQATAGSDILTPTSCQAHRVTKYKSANIEPKFTGISLVFVQAFKRMVMEFLADVFTGRYMAPHLTAAAKHITKNNIDHLAYQDEPTPIVWVRKGDGTWASATYRRVSAFTTEDPAFVAWAQHTLGSSRIVESLVGGPSVDGTIDGISMITNSTTVGDPSINVRWVEFLTTMTDETNTLQETWFLDDATNPVYIVRADGSGIDIYGMYYAQGQSIDITAIGLDLGTYVVGGGGMVGSVFIPFGTSNPLFTAANLAAYAPSGEITTTVTTKQPPGVPSTSHIQSYLTPGGDPSGTEQNTFFVVNWNTNTLYVFNTTGVAAFNVGTGALITSASYTTIGVANSIPDQDIAIDPDGNLYWSTGVSNSNPLYMISPNLVLLKTFGSSGVSTSYGTGNFTYPASLCTLRTFSEKWGPTDYVLGVSFAGGSSASWGMYQGQSGGGGAPAQPTTVVNLRGFSGNNGSTSASGFITLCQGVINDEPASAFGIDGGGNLYSWTVLDDIPDQRKSVIKGGFIGEILNFLFGICGGSVSTPTAPQVSFAKLGAVTAAEVSSGWSGFSTVGGLLYDQQDGNVIAWASASGGTGPPAAVFKLNAVNASVMWSVPVDGTTYFTCMNKGQCKFGLYTLLGYDADNSANYYPVAQIDTISGLVYWADVFDTRMAASAGQASNDATRSVTFFGSYTAATGAPTGDNGTTTFTSKYATLYPGSDLVKSLNYNSTLTNYAAGYPSTLTVISYGGGTVISNSWSGQSAVIAGFTYTTKCQILPSYVPQDAGSRNGPGFAKIKRAHQYGVMMRQGIGGKISFGTDFNHMHTAAFASDGGTLFNQLTMYNDVWWAPVDDNYDVKSKLCWEITRPVPGTVAAIGGFQHTQDK